MSDINSIFEQRKNEIKGIIENSQSNLKNQVSDAVKRAIQNNQSTLNDQVSNAVKTAIQNSQNSMNDAVKGKIDQTKEEIVQAVKSSLPKL